MILKDVLFLTAFSARSQAYAQAMAAADLAPENVLLFGNAKPPPPKGSEYDRETWEYIGVAVPDLCQPLETTFRKADWKIERCQAVDINDPELSRVLKQIGPKLVIYSGYGGQILKPEVLGLGCRFLHLHAGWLPDYRGSTTIYYSWLEENRCAVTALFLDEDIDTGPIIARRHYPPPPGGFDVDYKYDSAIRADLLVEVLRRYGAEGTLSTIPNTGPGRTYYVIHPVLKHIALLSQEVESDWAIVPKGNNARTPVT